MATAAGWFLAGWLAGWLALKPQDVLIPPMDLQGLNPRPPPTLHLPLLHGIPNLAT